jgi:putative oxidoreductase
MIEPKIVVVAGRVLIAALFVISGIGKILAPAGAMGYMISMGVPILLLWPTIALEVGGGTALALGFQVRFAAPALAVFSVIAAVVFHHKLSDPMQQLMFLKDFAVAGGLALAWAVDQRSATAQ